VVDPETVAITNSRSKEAFDRPCDETRSRSRALWQDANRMAIGNHALHPVLSFRAEARRPRRLWQDVCAVHPESSRTNAD